MSGLVATGSPVLTSNGNAQHAALHKAKAHEVPDTKIGDEGTAKRNIARKSSSKAKIKTQGGGRKNQWDPTDDGSTATGNEGVADTLDPNYDSHDEENYVLVSDSGMLENGAAGADGTPAAIPKLTLPDFKQRLSSILEEYFLSEDVDEVLRSVAELESSAYHYEIVKRGINMSLDRKDHERELVSKLLSDAYPSVLTTAEIGKGFQRLFEMIDDIQLDAPNARPLVASFLARAVVDEILPPSFLRNSTVASLGGDIVDGARRLLSRDHVLSRLERVWGPGDGRPVEELKVAIDQLLVEYLLSRQMDEAAQCVRDLNCKHFHHEIVKRGVKTALDKTDDDRAAMGSLLAYLRANEIVSANQMKMGFDRLYELMPDLVLDAPAAPHLLEKFTQQAIADGCLPSGYQAPQPSADGPPKPPGTHDELPQGDVPPPAL